MGVDMNRKRLRYLCNYLDTVMGTDIFMCIYIDMDMDVNMKVIM
jgi:hypothetical protein